MEQVRVGVIGVGRLGSFHARKYAANPSANLVGVVDTDHARAGKVAKETGCKVYEHLSEFLPLVGAVSVAAPTSLHHEIGLEVLDAGVHLLMEKPLTATSAQARELVEKAAGKELILQVGHIERFNPAVTALRDVTLSPRFVEAHRLAPYTSRGADVSVVHDLMIHDLDVLLHWMGREVERLDAAGVPVISQTPDIANARVTFSGRRVANLTASRISLKQMRKFRIFQDDTYISLDFIKRRAEIFRRVPPGTPKSLPIPGTVGGEFRMLIKRTRARKNEDALAREVDAFLQAIREHTPPIVSGEDALVALEVVEEIARQCEVR